MRFLTSGLAALGIRQGGTEKKCMYSDLQV